MQKLMQKLMQKKVIRTDESFVGVISIKFIKLEVYYYLINQGLEGVWI